MSLLSYGYHAVMLRLSFGKGSIYIRKRSGMGKVKVENWRLVRWKLKIENWKVGIRIGWFQKTFRSIGGISRDYRGNVEGISGECRRVIKVKSGLLHKFSTFLFFSAKICTENLQISKKSCNFVAENRLPRRVRLQGIDMTYWNIAFANACLSE